MTARLHAEIRFIYIEGTTTKKIFDSATPSLTKLQPPWHCCEKLTLGLSITKPGGSTTTYPHNGKSTYDHSPAGELTVD